MSTTDEQKIPTTEAAVAAATDDQAATADADSVTIATATATTKDAVIDQERSEKILKAKELYSHGSRNFLVKSYADAADELSDVCALYEQLYGELSDELGMPYLLYAKSLIALAVDENKVIDVPDEEDDDDNDEDDDDEDEEMDKLQAANGEAKGGAAAATNGKKLDPIEEISNDNDKKKDEADSTAEKESAPSSEKTDQKVSTSAEEAQVSSTNDTASAKTEKTKNGDTSCANGNSSAVVVAASSSSTAATASVAVPVIDGEKPSTSNGAAGGGDAENDGDNEEDENEAASTLQLAWEILELAAKIFSRQGLSGLPNLAEVQTELANIEFENNILEAAREDYEKALKIYGELPTNYRRAMAEIHYKIGLTYLMQQLNKEGAESLKDACNLIEGEIQEIQAKTNELTEKEKNNIQDMEETKQEIWAKIAEIEDTQAQNVAEVRAALDSYIKPISSQNKADGAGTSLAAASASGGASSSGNGAASSSSAITSSSKPTDISHLIKRKKPEEGSSEAEASPAKRPAV